MGVDARILVRKVPAALVTDAWLKKMSWLLCQSIGAEHFFIEDGLPPGEFEAAYEVWSKAFDAHPACKRDAKGHYAFNDAEREKILKDIGDSPKELRTAIHRAPYYIWEDDPVDTPMYEWGTAYNMTGEEVVTAEPDECMLSISTWGRYYGPGYERGNILVYCGIAEWLEENIPGCEVWYGGDTDSALAIFDAAARLEYRRHLYSEKGRDYFDKGWCEDSKHPRPPACSLCPDNTFCGSQTGSGPNFAAFRCLGCNRFASSKDGGDTWEYNKA